MPHRRKRDEQAELDALNPPEEKAPEPEVNSEGQEREEGQGEDQDQPQEEPEPQPTRSWYNMVCYGLPNMVVTQIGKV